MPSFDGALSGSGEGASPLAGPRSLLAPATLLSPAGLSSPASAADLPPVICTPRGGKRLEPFP